MALVILKPQCETGQQNNGTDKGVDSIVINLVTPFTTEAAGAAGDKKA